MLIKLLLPLLLAAAQLTVSYASCIAGHYPAPYLSGCIPCSTMFSWQIMGESRSAPIVSALVRLDNASKHVQCVTTNGLDCQWGRSEVPGSINDTSTLLALGCDHINSLYFPLPVYSGIHWCNQVWMFLHKYCGNSATGASPFSVRAKALTFINVTTASTFGPARQCNGTIAGGQALPGTSCTWLSQDTVQFFFSSLQWVAPRLLSGFRFVLGNELFLAEPPNNLTISNVTTEVFSISPPSSVVTFPITIRGVNFPLESKKCVLTFDVYPDLICNTTGDTTLESQNLPLNFPGLAQLIQVRFHDPYVSIDTKLSFVVVNKLPVVASLVPVQSYAGGIITVFGANFVPNVGSCSAVITSTSSFPSLKCFVVTSQTLIVQLDYTTAPSTAPGGIVITFTVPPTTSIMLPLRVLATPVIFGPAQPYAYLGSVVVLSGSSFHPADSQAALCYVCLNMSKCFVESETTIVLEVESSAGDCDVVVVLRTPQMRQVVRVLSNFTYITLFAQIFSHPRLRNSFPNATPHTTVHSCNPRCESRRPRYWLRPRCSHRLRSTLSGATSPTVWLYSQPVFQVLTLLLSVRLWSVGLQHRPAVSLLTQLQSSPLQTSILHHVL